jgi:hypothetical protein
MKQLSEESSTKAEAAPKKRTAKPNGEPLKQAVSKRQRGEDGKFLPGNSYGRWKRGESGNRNGRRDAVTDHLRRKLALVRVKSDGRTNAELIADMLLEEAIENRNVAAAREIFDRVEGKPRQTLDVLMAKTETERYENMILQLIESSKADGYNVSREEAISYLGQHDPRILELFPLASKLKQ